MPYFPAVGLIDDSLSPEDVMKEYRRRYSLASYHRRRAELVKQLGGKCSVCGSPDGVTFVKRKDSKGAPDFKINQIVNMSGKNRDKLLKYCALMCNEHAQESAHHKGRLTHGTYWSAYKKKCLCDDCGEYRANLALQRREDRRLRKSATLKENHD